MNENSLTEKIKETFFTYRGNYLSFEIVSAMIVNHPSEKIKEAIDRLFSDDYITMNEKGALIPCEKLVRERFENNTEGSLLQSQSVYPLKQSAT